MRFHDFSLRYYGGFENETLSFPQGSHDFHIIYGLNEAGKSTLLNAFRDFLFGFHRHTQGENWKYSDTSLIRLGATFSHDDHTQKAWRRRPANKRGDLFESDDTTPLEPLLLQSAHNGLSRDDFLRFWGLDHMRLRAGGESMADERQTAEKQSLSRQIGDGSNISDILKELEDAKKSYWAKRKKTARVNSLVAQYRAKLKELRESSTSTTKLNNARAHLDDMNEQYETLRTQQSDVSREINESTHLQDLISPYQAYTSAKRRFEDRPTPLFNNSESERIFSLHKEIREADLTCSEQRSLLKQYENEMEFLGSPSSIADEENILTHLIHNDTYYSDNDIEFREKDRHYDHLAQRKDDLLTQLSLPSSLELTSPSQLKPLISLSENYRDIIARRKERHNAVAKATSPSPLPEKPSTETQHALESWLNDAQNSITLDDDYDALSLIVSEKERRISTSLKALSPWESSFENGYAQLQALSPPSEEECQKEVTSFQNSENNLQKAGDKTLSLQQEYEQKKHEYQHLTHHSEWVSEDALKEARHKRDTLLEKIDPETFDASMWSSIQEAILTVDQVADQRFGSAHIDVKIRDLKSTKERLNLHISHAKTNEERAQNALHDVQEAWSNRLSEGNLPPLPPHQFTSWRQKRIALLEEYESYNESQDKRTHLLNKRNELATKLKTITTFEGTPSLKSLISKSKHLLSELTQKKALFERAVHDNDHIENTLKTLRSSQKETENDYKQWCEQWNNDAQSIGYPSSLSVDHLQLYQELLTVSHELQSVAVEKEKRDKKATDHQTQKSQILERYQAPSLEALTHKLREEKEKNEKRRLLLDKKQDAERSLTKHDDNASSLHESLAHFLKRLPEGSNIEHLLSYAQRDTETAATESAYINAREDLLSRSRERSLDDITASISTLDDHLLKEKLTDLERQKSLLEKEHEDILEKRLRAQDDLQELETKDKASHITEEIQTLKACIEEAAADYISLHTQHKLLKHMLSQQKDKLHGPLLALAGTLFSRLTLGDYEKLALEETKENTFTFVGFRPGYTEAVLLDHMSEGTRDQLYLALRLADIHQKLDHGISLPFFADDLFITFDDKRTKAGLDILAELSQRTQVFFFTHHRATLQHLPKETAQIVPLSQLT